MARSQRREGAPSLWPMSSWVGSGSLTDHQHVMTKQQLGAGVGVMVHPFDPITWEAESRVSLSLRPAWSMW